jgi:hypothetical protein
LNKPLVTIASQQCTEGYCRHKRSKSYVKDGEGTEATLRRVIKEENKLTLMILHLENHKKKLEKTLKSIENDSDFINEVVVVTNNFKTRQLRGLVKKLSSLKIRWTLSNMKIDYEVNPFEFAHNAADQVKNHWFLPVNSGELVDHTKMLELSSLIGHTNDNYVAFYFSLEDPLKVVANKFAFKEMEGHIGEPWFDKVKRFDNWKDVCRQI